MRRFFIGGSPELEDATYVKQPAGSENVRKLSILVIISYFREGWHEDIKLCNGFIYALCRVKF